MDAEGRIIATLDDYAAVYELTHDLIATAVNDAVSTTVRETVATVRRLIEESADGVSVTAVARTLGIDKGSASRRVKRAIRGGYVVRAEERPGRASRLAIGEPLPEEAGRVNDFETPRLRV